MQPDNWNAQDYEKSSSAQQKWAQELILKLNIQPADKILDIGCGDGKITAELAALVPQGSVIGIDSSEGMIQYAKTCYPNEKFPNLQFFLMDARQLTFQNEFTTIFSNAALHWVDNHLAVLQGIHHSLQPGGKVLLQMGGKGNAFHLIQVIEEMIQDKKWSSYFQDFSFPYFFYDINNYQTWLNQMGFEPIRIELIPKDMTHEGVAGLTGWIRTTWHPYTEKVPESMRESFISEWVERYLQKYPITLDGLTHVHMVRLEVEAKKLS